ncbi:unnamed protein product [Paramecium sonneborni]|uniref:Uncharacterized protein n=1 Tax=Paramecium sonneborni TaxID=65129 RepID=A0A8S1RW05_9CILI|nr:unnamed protein product [Paramecium sonneborni]
MEKLKKDQLMWLPTRIIGRYRVSTKLSWIILQTDITVVIYWITNPQNLLRRNRLGGSERYIFWHEIKTNSEGPPVIQIFIFLDQYT